MRIVNKPVEMISYSKPGEGLKPFKFRIMKEEKELIIKVFKVLQEKDIFESNIRCRNYVCTYQVGKEEFMCELYFDTKNLFWWLRKI